jgi:hypothetical protein
VKRKFVTLLGLAASVFAAGAFFRRATGRRRERADVYFDDGSMVSFVDDSPEAEALLDVARAALAAVRP